MRILIIGIFISLFCSTVQALPESGQNSAFVGINHASFSLDGLMPGPTAAGSAQLLAETAKETTPQPAAPQPESGSLVIPGEEGDHKEKKCLTVCKKWGQDCIINPRTGNSDCRRTCKEFGEECF